MELLSWGYIECGNREDQVDTKQENAIAENRDSGSLDRDVLVFVFRALCVHDCWVCIGHTAKQLVLILIFSLFFFWSGSLASIFQCMQKQHRASLASEHTYAWDVVTVSGTRLRIIYRRSLVYGSHSFRSFTFRSLRFDGTCNHVPIYKYMNDAEYEEPYYVFDHNDHISTLVHIVLQITGIKQNHRM